MARTKVLGLERLQRKLKQIPQEAKAEIKKALEASAEEIVKMAKNLAPVDQGDLQMSISWTWGEAPKGSFVIGSVVAPSDKNYLTITIYAGGKDAFYARWIEFGTQKMKAQPFFLPAYRSNRKRARARITRGITKAAKKVAAGR